MTKKPQAQTHTYKIIKTRSQSETDMDAIAFQSILFQYDGNTLMWFKFLSQLCGIPQHIFLELIEMFWIFSSLIAIHKASQIENKYLKFYL